MLRPPDVEREHALALALRAAALAADEGVAEAAYATVDSPVGTLVAVTTPRGLARLAYEDSGGGVDAVLDDVAARLSPAIVHAPARLDGLRRELEEYFEGRRRDFDLPIDWALVRTAFTVGVLRATAAIPFGATSTYRDVAAAAGSPAAFRAAGNALGSNPLPIVVPCHRVLASGGGLGGYTGGIERKRRLLAIEGLRSR
jgi:methylated-DNA-[protein]-cysteine S-methyltransferase